MNGLNATKKPSNALLRESDRLFYLFFACFGAVPALEAVKEEVFTLPRPLLFWL